VIRLRRPRSPVHAARQTAALLLALGALVLAARPPGAADPTATPPDTTAVVVAAADLAPGRVLTDGDLRLTGLPAEAVPEGAARSADDLLGRVLAGGLRRGEPVTDVRLVGPGLAALLAPGQVAAPLRLTDLAVAELVRPGDRVDVLATAPDSPTAEVVAAGVLVLAPSPADDAGPTGADAGAGLLVLAVDDATGARLAAAATSDTLSVTLAPP
jgi:Flp pilus assembly protein CpaB